MNKSFTLIEILIVIVIIGILSAFILVGINSISDSANIAKFKVFSDSIDNTLLLDRVSYWNLEASTNDLWKTNNGTWSGPTAPNTTANYRPSSECVSGQCLHFDGVDDMVNFGNNSSLSMGTKDHTVSIWVRFDNATAPMNETLFYCGASSGVGYDGYWIMRYTGTSRLRVYFTDGSIERVSAYLTPEGSLISNTWYFILITFDRDYVAKAYINTKILAGSAYLDISGQQGNIENYTNLSMGRITSSILAGKIDEPKIYHSIASSQLINQEYYSGISNLLVNNGINHNDYIQRLSELKSNLAKQ